VFRKILFSFRKNIVFFSRRIFYRALCVSRPSPEIVSGTFSENFRRIQKAHNRFPFRSARGTINTPIYHTYRTRASRLEIKSRYAVLIQLAHNDIARSRHGNVVNRIKARDDNRQSLSRLHLNARQVLFWISRRGASSLSPLPSPVAHRSLNWLASYFASLPKSRVSRASRAEKTFPPFPSCYLRSESRVNSATRGRASNRATNNHREASIGGIIRVTIRCRERVVMAPTLATSVRGFRISVSRCLPAGWRHRGGDVERTFETIKVR